MVWQPERNLTCCRQSQLVKSTKSVGASNLDKENMAIYFQHVGAPGSARDFPRTIGTPKTGLVRFQLSDVMAYITDLLPDEVSSIERAVSKGAPDGFQIWGVPSGAKFVIKNMQAGDYLMLLNSIQDGGMFTYGGMVLARLSQECDALSQHLWREPRFPLIVFLKGALIEYPWEIFCDEFSFKHNWNPAGNTYRLRDERLVRSPHGNSGEFVASLNNYRVGKPS